MTPLCLALLAWTWIAPRPAPQDLDAAQGAQVRDYAALAHHLYLRAETGARDVEEAVGALLDAPSPASLEAARAAWIAARDAYGQTEALRFYNGPIDNPRTGVETLLNAWPLDEAYVDYVVGAPGAGLINDPERYPYLDDTLLALLNERGGEANVCVGWHALEFMLWGQDLAEDGPGARSHLDFVAGAAPNAERRAAYLRIVAGLLVEHLATVRRAWEPDADNYRAAFESAPPRESVRKALAGIVVLSGFELAGERLAVGFETRDQEDEHSCFSDNTHADFVANQLGVVAVYRGSAQGYEGVGLRTVAQAAEPELAERIDRQLEATLEALRALPVPFDAGLRAADGSPERAALARALVALERQAELLATLGLALGHEIALVPGG